MTVCDDSLALLKRFLRQSCRQTTPSQKQADILATLKDRINAGTADRRLIPYLNRLTAFQDRTESRSRFPFRAGADIGAVLGLYESLIAEACTRQSIPYLLAALRSTYRERAGEAKFVSVPEFVREYSESETGPDWCGHINTRTTYYRVYAQYHHYDRIRPLAQRAAERLYGMAEEGLISPESVQRAIDHAESLINPEVAVECCESTEYDREEIEGDRGYW